MILALDLSSRTGWAWGPTVDAKPSFGAWQMPIRGGLAARFYGLQNAMQEFCEEHLVTKVVIEAPIPLPAMNNTTAAYQQLGMRAIVMAEAQHISAAICEIDCWTVRSEVAGMRRCTSDQAKKQAVLFCLKRGLKVPNHDAADAVLLWLWHRQRTLRQQPYAGPLFDEVA